jgi:alkaline phosphatase D
VSLTRRQFLWTAAAASLSWPLHAQVERASSDRRFQHGVASGDPLSDRIIIWTRVTPRQSSLNQPVTVRWRVATDADAQHVVSSGTFETTAARDYTVKADVGGLMPGGTYYYAFDVDCEQSPIGRTKTFPTSGAARMRFALVCCSNYPAGFFNVYTAITRRPDLDAVVHVGYYIYEFAEGEYGAGVAINRVPEPPREAIALTDYRMRYATYRTDPDLQEAHRLFPSSPSGMTTRSQTTPGRAERSTTIPRRAKATGERARQQPTRRISSGCRFESLRTPAFTSIARFRLAASSIW